MLDVHRMSYTHIVKSFWRYSVWLIVFMIVFITSILLLRDWGVGLYRFWQVIYIHTPIVIQTDRQACEWVIHISSRSLKKFLKESFWNFLETRKKKWIKYILRSLTASESINDRLNEKYCSSNLIILVINKSRTVIELTHFRPVLRFI